MLCRYYCSVVNLAVFVAGTNRVVISKLLVNERTVVCNNFCIVNLTQTMFFDLAGIDVCLLATKSHCFFIPTDTFCVIKIHRIKGT